MSLSRFHRLSRQLFMSSPLHMPRKEVKQMSSYSARRLLPSLADLLQLSPADRANIGTWKGGRRSERHGLDMANAYSAFRLRAVAASRAKVLEVVDRG